LGIPIIGANKSSLEEMVIDGETGYIFENSESKELKNKIEEILDLPFSEYQGMKKNVNILYKNILSENRTQALITYYKKTLNEFKQEK
jgi:glycosyltransferase involved in cell wall biosynthesis